MAGLMAQGQSTAAWPSEAERRRERRSWLRDIRKWRRSLPPGHYNSYVHKAFAFTGRKWHWTWHDRRGKRIALCCGPKSFLGETCNTDKSLECKRCRAALVKGDGTYWVLPANGEV